MERREIIKKLEIERDKELNVVYEKYKPKFKELQYTFTLNELLKEG